MHIKLLIVFYLLSVKANGQNIPFGTFKYSPGFTTFELKIDFENKFEYKYSGCSGHTIGSGLYKVKDNKIILNFNNPIRPESEIKLSKESNISDSSHLNFEFFDSKDSSSVPGVIVKCGSKNPIYSQSNMTGISKLTVGNSEFPLQLNFNSIGAQPRSFTIDTAGNYTIKCPINTSGDWQYFPGESLIFEIVSIDDNEIILKLIDKKDQIILSKEE